MPKAEMSRRSVLKIGVAGLTLALPFKAKAAEAPPSAIRLAGPGAGYGKPYGLQGLGIVRAQELLEKEFAKENVTITWDFPTKAGPAINEEIAAGQIDFSAYGGLPNIIGRGRGLPTRILSSYGAGNSFLVVRKDLGVTRIEDLKGKKVGMNRGSIGELTLVNLLKAHGLKESDVQLFDITNPDQISGLTTGNLDFGWGGSNFLKLTKDGVLDLLYDTKKAVSSASSFGSFVVTDAFADAYPETTRRVLKVFLQASAWGSKEENRDALLDLWALSGQSKAVMETEFEGVDLPNLFSPLIDDLFLAQLQSGIDFSLENKFVRSPIDLNAWIDRKPLDAEIKALGYENIWVARDASGKPINS